jgi:hypothetical protein
LVSVSRGEIRLVFSAAYLLNALVILLLSRHHVPAVVRVLKPLAAARVRGRMPPERFEQPTSYVRAARATGASK